MFVTPTGKRHGYLHPKQKIDKPFHTLHLDHLGPFCKSAYGNSYVAGGGGAFKKFTWIEPVQNIRSVPVISCLKMLIKFCGNPTRIIIDRGKGFSSKEMAAFCKSENIRHVLYAIASPRSNG